MSEQYRALTRKYRPVNFEDIVSQEHVSNTLKNAIEHNRLSHAYLFCGPRGVGKTTMARVLARTINEVDAAVDGEALGNTLNIVEIDAASNNGVDDVRMLRERVRIPPQNGRYKVYIIDEVHMLSKQAFNALLKTLEEPPAHAIFIFATTEPHKVLPTILSRCQRFDFRRIKVDEIVGRLKAIASTEQISIDEESLHVVARKADGALRDALGILDQVIAFCGTDIRHEEVLRALNLVSADILFDLTDAIIGHDSSVGMNLIDRVLLDGHDIQEFLIGLTEHFRNLYFARESDNLSLIEASADMKERYKRISASFSEDDLMRMLHITNEAQYKVREAHQPRIQLEVTVLKLIRMERSAGLASLMNEIRALKQMLDGNGGESDGTGGPATGKSRTSADLKSTTASHTARGENPALNSPDAPHGRVKQPGQVISSGQAPSTGLAASPQPATSTGHADAPGRKPASGQESMPDQVPPPSVPADSSRKTASTGQKPNPDTPDATGLTTSKDNENRVMPDESLFGTPSIPRTKSRLSAVSRDDAVISTGSDARSGSDSGSVSGLGTGSVSDAESGSDSGPGSGSGLSSGTRSVSGSGSGTGPGSDPGSGSGSGTSSVSGSGSGVRTRRGGGGDSIESAVFGGNSGGGDSSGNSDGVRRDRAKSTVFGGNSGGGGGDRGVFGGNSGGSGNSYNVIYRDRESNDQSDTDNAGMAVAGNLALATKSKSAIHNHDEDARSSTVNNQPEIFLHDVRKIWDDYLNLVKAKSTTAVFFAMQNAEPVDLNRGELTVRCPDMFALNLIRENSTVMQECMKKAAGVPLRFHCVLRPVNEKEKAANDPYAQFKKLQQDDPRIKTIIDLFGAELEY